MRMSVVKCDEYLNRNMKQITIMMPYNSKYNVLSASLNKTSFQPVHHDWCNKGCGMCYPCC